MWKTVCIYFKEWEKEIFLRRVTGFSSRAVDIQMLFQCESWSPLYLKSASRPGRDILTSKSPF